MNVNWEQEYEIEIHFNVTFCFYNALIRYKEKI